MTDKKAYARLKEDPVKFEARRKQKREWWRKKHAAKERGNSRLERLRELIAHPSPVCINWPHATTPKYHHPILTVNYKQVYARRLVMEWRAGEPLPQGAEIRSTCNNTLCVNPDHLYLFQTAHTKPRGRKPHAQD